MAIATKILIAEDDPDIAGLMTLYIEREGWHAHPVTTGEAALAYARTQPVDVAVLDIMLPGLDGLELVRLLRAHDTTARLPIIMVTAKADENDRIGGLEIGADDYLTKPFSPKELIARIRALLRRTGRQEPAAALVAGPLTMDLSRHTVSEDGREVTLTAKEFLLLQYFLEHPDRVLSRDLLLTEVWGYRYTGGTRTVDVHIRRLREKLPTLAGTLVTVKQFGYKLVERGSNVD